MATQHTKIRDEIVRLMNKAPRGKRGARGHLVHLQDPSFNTDDGELLMTRPTLALSRLVEMVCNKHHASRKDVKNQIEALVEQNVVGVSKSRSFNGIPKLIPIKQEKNIEQRKSERIKTANMQDSTSGTVEICRFYTSLTNSVSINTRKAGTLKLGVTQKQN